MRVQAERGAPWTMAVRIAIDGHDRRVRQRAIQVRKVGAAPIADGEQLLPPGLMAVRPPPKRLVEFYKIPLVPADVEGRAADDSKQPCAGPEAAITDLGVDVTQQWRQRESKL